MLDKVIPTLNGTGPAPVATVPPAAAPAPTKRHLPKLRKPSSIVAKFKEVREAAGISQGKAAEIMGVSNQSVSTWELGWGNPRAENLKKIHKFIRDHWTPPKEIVVKRFNRPPLRFKGKLLGSDHFSGKLVTLWKTEAGTYVWGLKNDADYGDVQAFEAWAKKLWPNILTSKRQTQALLGWAYDMGLEIFEDID